MDQTKEKTNIKENILEKIKTGQAKIKPRWYFVLRWLGMVAGIFVATGFLIYLVSFIAFILRETGVGFGPWWGVIGWGLFLWSAPWFLIGLAAAILLVLEYLLRQPDFGYRRPILYSVAAILILIIAGSWMMSRSGLHQHFLRYAEEGRLPIAGTFYRKYSENRPQNIRIGMVGEIKEDGFWLKEPTGEKLFIPFTEEDDLSKREIEENDRVVALVRPEGEGVVPFRWQKMEENMIWWKLPLGEGESQVNKVRR